MLSKDQKYIDGIKTNNPELVNEINDEFYPEVENFVFLNGGTKKDARRAFKAVLINIWEKLQFEDINLTIPFGAYFYLKYRNNWLKRNRTKENKNITDLGNYVEYIPNKGDKRFIQTDESKNELIDILKPNISKLDSRSRLIYQLKYIYDKSDEEIAKILKMPSKEIVCDEVNGCNLKLVEQLKSNAEYSNIADDANFQQELEQVLVEHYKREAQIDSDHREDFKEVLNSSFVSKKSTKIETDAKDRSKKRTKSKRLLSRAAFLAFGILMLLGGFYFVNSKNSISSLADYYYFPYQYESNVAISLPKFENAKPSAKEIVKDNNARVSTTPSTEKIIEDHNENNNEVLRVPRDNTIGNSKLLLAKACEEYDSGNYREAIITLNTVLNKTANKDVKDDANWYLALCYLKRTNKKQAVKLLKLQSEASTHYDIAQELISYLE